MLVVLERRLLAKVRISPRLQEPSEQEPLFSAPSHLLIEFLDMVPRDRRRFRLPRVVFPCGRKYCPGWVPRRIRGRWSYPVGPVLVPAGRCGGPGTCPAE